MVGSEADPSTGAGEVVEVRKVGAYTSAPVVSPSVAVAQKRDSFLLQMVGRGL